jgi:hypothetical protein
MEKSKNKTLIADIFEVFMASGFVPKRFMARSKTF